MLNFDDVSYDKTIKYNESLKDEKIDMETLKFHNSLYSKHNLSDFILVDKKPKK
jgi:hypothetical protein